jgi:maltose O-acetyltransferase
MVHKAIRRVNAVLLESDNMILRWVGCIPSHHVRRFFYRLEGMRIGRGSTIHTGAVFYKASNIKIGQDTIIGENAVLDGRDKLTIGDHTDIASEVMIYNAEHDINDDNFAAVTAPVEVGDYVFIGPRAIILPGIKIGKGAVIGAGAVVTKNVDDFMIVGGVPAKVIGERKLKDPKYRLGRAAWFR